MAVPRNKISKSVKRKRRTHFKLTAKQLTKCTNCGQPCLPHHVCKSCGYYKGHEVIAVVE